MTRDLDPRCPVATMDPFAREFLAKCHALAHHGSVKAGKRPGTLPLTADGTTSGTCRRVCIGVGHVESLNYRPNGGPQWGSALHQ